jgi:putative ABC transport system ATP-binding protein
MPMGLISAENVTKDYQIGEVMLRALRGLTFEIEPASFISFIGPSGSWKTTLLNLIGCLDKPTKGTLVVFHAQTGNAEKIAEAVAFNKEVL